MLKKPELLAPAGSLEKLKIAILYGADAVYFGGEAFSLRVAAENFSQSDIERGINFAHERGRKAYAAVNIIPHNEDLDVLPEYISQLSDMGTDAIILADPGVFNIVREVAPNMPIHISTQANNLNWRSAQFWHKLGAQRIVLARELSFAEIADMRTRVSNELELEAFVHGAMCISYSGRCLLSNYMTGRDANRGACAQSCRWNYYVVEEKRPGEYMPLVETERGSFIFNSKDLCMIEQIPQIIKSGISSLKIEGRVKTEYYVASVVKAYRECIDKYCENPDKYVFDTSYIEELAKVSHREYTTGFYNGDPSTEGQNYKTSSYVREYDVIGIVKGWDGKTITIEQRNRFFVGDEIEILQPSVYGHITHLVTQMQNENGDSIAVAPHAQMLVKFPFEQEVKIDSFVRKKKHE